MKIRELLLRYQRDGKGHYKIRNAEKREGTGKVVTISLFLKGKPAIGREWIDQYDIVLLDNAIYENTYEVMVGPEHCIENPKLRIVKQDLKRVKGGEII